MSLYCNLLFLKSFGREEGFRFLNNINKLSLVMIFSHQFSHL